MSAISKLTARASCDPRMRPSWPTSRFAFQDYAQGGKTSYKTLPVPAFIGPLIRHVPDKHFKMVRYAVLLATRWRRHYLAHARVVLNQTEFAPPETPPACTLAWWERRRAAGPDPLWCPICQVLMQFERLVFGAHEPIAELFRLAGKRLALVHPAWDTGWMKLLRWVFAKVTDTCTHYKRCKGSRCIASICLKGLQHRTLRQVL
jgi:hypothetical protein